MSASADGETRGRGGRKAFWHALAGVLAGGLILAHAHLVYVARGSQPHCEPQANRPGEAGGFRAARPSC